MIKMSEPDYITTGVVFINFSNLESTKLSPPACLPAWEHRILQNAEKKTGYEGNALAVMSKQTFNEFMSPLMSQGTI